MDILKELFTQIPQKDLKEFEQFIQKYKNKASRKDLELISLLTSKKELKAKEYTQELYGSHRLNTYQALRKRLLKQLTVFITQKHMSDDQSATSLLSGYISIIQYMLDNNNDFLAWTFMKKAEDLAIKTEHYDLLNTIYNYQIEHSSSPFANELNTTIKKKINYRAIAEQEEKYSMVYALVSQKLLEIKHANVNLNIDETIKKLFKQNDINTDITDNPKAIFQLVKIARSATIAKRDFHNLHQYISSQYQRLESKNAFNKSNHIYKLEILFMLCHALYRNRNFNECVEQIENFEQELEKYNGLYKKRFSTKITMLKSSTLAYTDRVDRAIQTTENLLDQSIKESDRLGALLNLGFYYFINNNLNKAAQINLRIGHTDRWCLKQMGQEWLLKKNLMEIIIQYELENYEIALNRIKLFKKHFSDLMEHSLYHRLKYYIEFTRKLITDSNTLKSEVLISEIKKHLIIIPAEQEDLQAMAFYSWFKSKVNKTTYKEALIDTIN